ncbi:unnamed protein product [Orchesella dallaii]|uniref:Uncharacterized protein n=1 Tax=Orchesella dallaii TaxID=48710 RepID=A0ABP1QP42_9HEXA
MKAGPPQTNAPTVSTTPIEVKSDKTDSSQTAKQDETKQDESKQDETKQDETTTPRRSPFVNHAKIKYYQETYRLREFLRGVGVTKGDNGEVVIAGQRYAKCDFETMLNQLRDARIRRTYEFDVIQEYLFDKEIPAGVLTKGVLTAIERHRAKKMKEGDTFVHTGWIDF